MKFLNDIMLITGWCVWSFTALLILFGMLVHRKAERLAKRTSRD